VNVKNESGEVRKRGGGYLAALGVGEDEGESLPLDLPFLSGLLGSKGTEVREAEVAEGFGVDRGGEVVGGIVVEDRGGNIKASGGRAERIELESVFGNDFRASLR
jgi:hypothetical protein